MIEGTLGSVGCLDYVVYGGVVISVLIEEPPWAETIRLFVWFFDAFFIFCVRCLKERDILFLEYIYVYN